MPRFGAQIPSSIVLLFADNKEACLPSPVRREVGEQQPLRYISLVYQD